MHGLNNRSGRITRKLFYAFFILVIYFLLGGIICYLWNFILPGLIRAGHIDYPHALALLLLSRILFGRFNFPGKADGFYNRYPNHFLKDKLMSMSEGDRAAFKEEWHKRRGRHR